MIGFALNPSLVNSGDSLLCPNYQRWGSKLLTTKLINFPAFTCQVLNLTEFEFCYHNQRQTKGGNLHLFYMLIICKSTLQIETSTGNVSWQKKSLLTHYSMFSSKKCSFPPATLSTPDVMLRCHYLQAILQVTHSSFVKTKIKLKQLHCSFVTQGPPSGYSISEWWSYLCCASIVLNKLFSRDGAGHIPKE